MSDPKNDCDDTKCGTCPAGDCPVQDRLEGETDEAFRDRQQLARQMSRIRNKILILSGKGGVGKSTVAVNLAMSLSMVGKKVGLLDIDVHGPSVPQMLKVPKAQVYIKGERLIPVQMENLKVMSLGYMLRDAEEAVIWRGPMKMQLIRQFLKDVDWGELDYLIIDCPPGTGDEPLSVVQFITDATGAVIVTTPQEVALADVRRSITFCRHVKLSVLGVIENMSGFVCPKCGEVTDIFSSGGGQRLAEEMKVPFLGRVPLDPMLVLSGDQGKPFTHFYSETETAKAFNQIVQPILIGTLSPSVSQKR